MFQCCYKTQGLFTPDSGRQGSSWVAICYQPFASRSDQVSPLSSVLSSLHLCKCSRRKHSVKSFILHPIPYCLLFSVINSCKSWHSVLCCLFGLWKTCLFSPFLCHLNLLYPDTFKWININILCTLLMNMLWISIDRGLKYINEYSDVITLWIFPCTVLYHHTYYGIPRY